MPFTPPEIWQEIFTWLPVEAARTCLSVSGGFHALASRIVFRNVRISFGAWESAEARDDVYAAEMHAFDALEDKMSSMAAAILHRISHDSSFATIVQSMDVHAYKRDGTRGAFERECLIEAIHCMHNLRSFTWHGTAPRPTPEIIEALASTCTMLRHFSAPLSTMSSLEVDRLDSLWSLGYTWKWFHDTTRGRRSRLPPEARDLAIHCESLRELQMPYTSPKDIPLDRLPMLTHLELLSIQVLDDLGSVMLKVPQLESLSVFCTRRQHGNLFKALANLKSALPNLHSLCLLSRQEGVLEAQHVQVFSDFLLGRTRIRRFRSTFKFCADNYPLFLTAIASLRNLEVLHWDVFTEDITRDFMYMFLQHLPSGMLAMSMASAGLFRDPDAFVDAWARCPNLRFLYVRIWGSEEELAERLLHGAKHAQVVGYNGKFYNVEAKDGELHLSSPWSTRKVAFRSPSDFGPGCEAAEWLMRGLRIARSETEEEGQRV